MKNFSILVILVTAFFTTTVFAEGNMGNGGRGTAGDGAKIETVKEGTTTVTESVECTPTQTDTCEGNMGNGGRTLPDSTIIVFGKYMISFFF